MQTQALPKNRVVPSVIPNYFYYNSEIWEQEKQAIFYRTWNFVGHLERVKEPGQYFTYRLLDRNIVILRDRDRVLRAFYNVCPHRGHELVQGEGQLQRISCPYHAWMFNTDGSLHRASFSHEIDTFNPAPFNLKPVQIEEICGLLFVNLDSSAQSLTQLIPDFEQQLQTYTPDIAHLTLAYRKAFTVNCNWKNLIENALEDYHTLSVHPGLKNNVTVDSFHSVTTGITSYQIYRPKADNNGRYSLNDRSNFVWWWLWIWPNMQISTFPDRGVRISRVYPITPTTSHWTFEFYLTTPTPNDKEKENIERLVNTTLLEDIAAVESVQRGQQSLGSHYGHLMVSTEPDRHWSELGIYHFQNLIKNALKSS
jgi:choline monooxygenase